MNRVDGQQAKHGSTWNIFKSLLLKTQAAFDFSFLGMDDEGKVFDNENDYQ
jgi:hypothetical protein